MAGAIQDYVCPFGHEKVPHGFKGLVNHIRDKHGVHILEQAKAPTGATTTELSPEQEKQTLASRPSARFEWGEPWDPEQIKREKIPEDKIDEAELHHGDDRRHFVDDSGNRRRISDENGPKAVHNLRTSLHENGIEPKYIGVGGPPGNRAIAMNQYTGSPVAVITVVVIIAAAVLAVAVGWAAKTVGDAVYRTFVEPLGPLGFLIPLAFVGVAGVVVYKTVGGG